MHGKRPISGNSGLSKWISAFVPVEYGYDYHWMGLSYTSYHSHNQSRHCISIPDIYRKLASSKVYVIFQCHLTDFAVSYNNTDKKKHNSFRYTTDEALFMFH